VNGVDPANEKTNEGAKGTTQPALASTNPGAGKTLNLFA
jgi:hypothetical protein